MIKKQRVVIFSDGGARGNPGPAAIGGTIRISPPLSSRATPHLMRGSREISLYKFSKYIGETTNNDAEYQAVIYALEKAKELLGDKAEEAEIEVNVDSELIYKQVRGEYKVKNPNLQKLFIKLWNLRQQFADVKFNHVRREKNTEADALVNEALDEHASQ